MGLYPPLLTLWGAGVRGPRVSARICAQLRVGGVDSIPTTFGWSTKSGRPFRRGWAIFGDGLFSYHASHCQHGQPLIWRAIWFPLGFGTVDGDSGGLVAVGLSCLGYRARLEFGVPSRQNRSDIGHTCG